MKQFLSPYSIEECAQRIKSLEGPAIPPLPTRVVKLRYINSDSYEFVVERWAFLNLAAIVQGSMKREDKNTTSVIVHSSMPTHLKVTLFLYFSFAMVIFTISIVRGQYNHLPPIFVFGFWGFITLIAWRQWGNFLMRTVINVIKW